MLSIQIDKYLEEQGTSQAELGRRMNVSRQRAHQIVKEASAIRFETLAAVCRALNCQPGDLLKMVDEDDVG